MNKSRILKPAPVRRLDWPLLVGGAVLAVAVIAAYCRIFSFPMLFDDGPAIVDNPTIRQWGSAFFPPIDTTAGGRPIVNLSLALNYAISGTSVWSYHAANLAIHVLAGLTLLGIVRRTLAPRSGPAAALIAFCAALLWALHPLQTESVTYIVQRAESLMGLFYLLTLYCFIRGVQADRRRQRLWFISCVAACLVGMATKEVMCSAPVIVFLYDRTFLAGTFREAWRRRWRVFAGLGATWLLLLFLVRSTHGRNGSFGVGSGVSWWSYALAQFPAIAHYLRLSVWPHPLTFDYGTQWVTGLWAVLPYALLVVALIAATTWALLCPGMGCKALGFAGAWFFAILAPTSLMPGNRQTAAEHRMYLALIPLVLLAVVGLHRRLGRATLPVCVAFAAGLFAITCQRNEDYRSALILWSDTVVKAPANPWAHNHLGYELTNIPGRLNDAIAQFEEALRLKPDYAEAHDNLGFALEKVPGRMNDAIDQFREALRLKPEDAEAHYNLGYALEVLPGLLNAAIAQYEEALRLKPGFAEIHLNLGNALEKLPGRMDEAIAQYEEALRLKPGLVEAHNNLGYALEKLPGRLNEAISQYAEALRLKPDFAEAHFNLAIALLKMPGHGDEAGAHLEAVLQLQPDNDAARQILAGIRASQR